MKKQKLPFIAFRIMTAVLLILTVSTGIFSVCAENSATDGSGNNTAVYYRDDESSYQKYKEKNSDKPSAENEVAIKGGNDTYNNRDSIAEIKQDQAVSYKFVSPADGLYEIRFTYLPIKKNGGALEFSFKADGKLPFTEAENFTLPHFYADNGEKRHDDNGNEYSPEQIDYSEFVTKALYDDSGVETSPYRFYFSAGEHTLEISNNGEAFVLADILLCKPSEPAQYDEIKSDSMQETKAEPIILEGEETLRKSNRSIVAKSDTSSLAVSPSSATKQLINYIGLTNWKTPGEEVVWKFTVKTDGWYDFRTVFKQDQTVNGYSYRTLKIDGEVPFAEAENMKFYYGTSWQKSLFADEDGNPYYIYLKSGEHTLSLTATMGETAEYYRRLKEITTGLGNLYLQITMITSDSPDSERDYDLFKQIDNFDGTLKELADSLEELAKDMKALSGNQTTSCITSIKNMSRVLRDMIKNPYTAQNYVKDYYNSYTTVSAWLYDMQAMPLGIDRIVFVPYGNDYDIDMPSMFSKIRFGIKRFVVSFSDEYSTSIDGDGKSIKLWVNWGRDQAMVLNSLIEESFTPETGIKVNLQITDASLINGILSGNAPDLQLHLARTEPVNLALRGALYDLTQFSDYDEVVTRFSETATVPYIYNNGVYALPDTQSFYLMFYRTDVFEALNLEVPETWDEFLAVTAVLQRNNMASWIPYTQISASNTVNTGVGGLNLFASILQQNGAELYNEDRNHCFLDSKLSYKAFSYWTEMYTKYKMPTTASFYNRFRIGTMPLGIELYTTYTQLKQAAPEIDGRWSIATVPGTRREDGTIDKTVSGAGTGCGILSSSQNKEEAWEFLKWWTSEDTQLKYNNNVESILGAISRSTTATTGAFEQMVWTAADLKVLMEQRSYIKEIPEVAGSYYVSRAVDQAFWSVVNDGEAPKDALMKWSDIANNEIERKIKQYEGE